MCVYLPLLTGLGARVCAADVSRLGPLLFCLLPLCLHCLQPLLGFLQRRPLLQCLLRAGGVGAGVRVVASPSSCVLWS